jgi:hypothetical protein
MATIGVGKGSYMRPHRRVRMRKFRVDASQTIKVGYLVVLSADSDEGNRIKKAAADPTTDRAIVGIAAQDITTGASPTAADAIDVWLTTGDAEFIAHVQASETLDNDDISVEFGLVEDTTNEIYRVDTSETTAKLVRVLELVHEHGDTEGQVVVSFIAPERLYHD